MNKEKINLLDVIPCIAEYVMTEKEGGLSRIAFPRFKHRFMQKYMMPKRIAPYLHITFEEHGTAVWDLIDGKRTIREIIKMLEEHFNGEENYDRRVTMFLDQLERQGFIKYMHA